MVFLHVLWCVQYTHPSRYHVYCMCGSVQMSWGCWSCVLTWLDCRREHEVITHWCWLALLWGNKAHSSSTSLSFSPSPYSACGYRSHTDFMMSTSPSPSLLPGSGLYKQAELNLNRSQMYCTHITKLPLHYIVRTTQARVLDWMNTILMIKLLSALSLLTHVGFQNGNHSKKQLFSK